MVSFYDYINKVGILLPPLGVEVKSRERLRSEDL